MNLVITAMQDEKILYQWWAQLLIVIAFYVSKSCMVILHLIAGIILGMGSANERRCYIVMPPLIGWASTQNYFCVVYLHRAINNAENVSAELLDIKRQPSSILHPINTSFSNACAIPGTSETISIQSKSAVLHYITNTNGILIKLLVSRRIINQTKELSFKSHRATNTVYITLAARIA